MSGRRIQALSLKKKAVTAMLLADRREAIQREEFSGEVEDNLEKELMSFTNTELSAAAAAEITATVPAVAAATVVPAPSSSPVNISRRGRRRDNLTYTIRPEEYSVIEEDDNNSDAVTQDFNLDNAFIESMHQELDESMDKLSSSASSSSSSSSISYLLQMAQKMIANYPNEEQLAGMIAENYLNYIAELARAHPPMMIIQSSTEEQEKAMNTNNHSDDNDDSVILLESASAQTSFSFEQQQPQQQGQREDEDSVEDMQQE